MRYDFRNLRRRSQTPFPSPIDWSNPLTRDLVALYSHGELSTRISESFINKVSNAFPSGGTGNTYAIKSTMQGVGVTYPASVAYQYTTDSLPGMSGATVYSIFALAADITLDSAFRSILDRDNGATTRCFQFRINNANKAEFIRFNGAGSAFFATDSTAITSTEATRGVCMVAVANGSAHAIYMNGRKTAGTAITGTPTGMQSSILVGCQAQNTQPFNGTLVLWGALARALSDAEVYALTDNPWQLMRARPRVLHFPGSVTGGGGGGAAAHRWFLAA